MGCCDSGKKCQNAKKSKRIPWFAIVICVFAFLVILNWR